MVDKKKKLKEKNRTFHRKYQLPNQNGKKRELIKKVLRSNLKSKLHSIYYDDVNLETTMECECTCCKVAMPQLNYSEFIQIATVLWDKSDHAKKIQLICTSISYFFKNEFEKWGMESLIKPCMLLDDKGLCTIYEDRPLACRLYGLWPEDEYNSRVDRFAAAYAEFGLEKEDLPLYKQCDKVKRVDESIPLNTEIISELYEKLDRLDKKVGDFSETQISAKENYRTFHDWLLVKTLGEEWLSDLTTFMMAADKQAIEEQIVAIQEALKEAFAKTVPSEWVEKL